MIFNVYPRKTVVFVPVPTVCTRTAEIILRDIYISQEAIDFTYRQKKKAVKPPFLLLIYSFMLTFT